ncbi:hypothetical protein KJ972_01520 [Candidatus Micrarchaeota archaeon]|nr:hypothetical protein [Candidatus Micrarchaeota archaeon]
MRIVHNDNTKDRTVDEPVKHRYTIYIDRFKAGKKMLFATNPAVQKILEKRNSVPIKPIGMVVVEVMKEETQMLKTRHFHPLDGARYLTGKGLGSFIEYQIERDLLPRFPGYSIRSVAFPKDLRVRQFQNRHRKRGKPIPLEEDVVLLRIYLANELKYRFKRRQVFRSLGRRLGLFRETKGSKPRLKK